MRREHNTSKAERKARHESRTMRRECTASARDPEHGRSMAYATIVRNGGSLW
jgi:hypothetical protein